MMHLSSHGWDIELGRWIRPNIVLTGGKEVQSMKRRRMNMIWYGFNVTHKIKKNISLYYWTFSSMWFVRLKIWIVKTTSAFLSLKKNKGQSQIQLLRSFGLNRAKDTQVMPRNNYLTHEERGHISFYTRSRTSCSKAINTQIIFQRNPGPRTEVIILSTLSTT